MGWKSAVASLVGAGIGGLFGASSGKMSDEQWRAYDLAVGAGELGLRRAGDIAPHTTGLLNLAGEGYQSSFDYWSRILEGDRSEMTAALSPEIARIGEGYTQARRETSQFAPRGGGRASTLGEIPFRSGRDISELFAKMRPLAAQSLGQLSGEAGRLGATTGFLEAQLGGMPISAAQATLPWLEQNKQNWWNRIMQGARGGGEIGSSLADTLGTGKKTGTTGDTSGSSGNPLGNIAPGSAGSSITGNQMTNVNPWLAGLSGQTLGSSQKGPQPWILTDPFRRAP